MACKCTRQELLQANLQKPLWHLKEKLRRPGWKSALNSWSWEATECWAVDMAECLLDDTRGEESRHYHGPWRGSSLG